MPVKKARSRRTVPRKPSPLKFRRAPSTRFKKGAKCGSYSFSEHRRWVFEDKIDIAQHNDRHRVFENQLNIADHRLERGYSTFPNLVLRDAKGVPRFVLTYSRHRGGDLLLIQIQRERTIEAYRGTDAGEFFSSRIIYNSEIETKRSKQFQEKLGVHPSEFLLSEFIYRNRKQIRRRLKEGGVGVCLVDTPVNEMPQVYKPIIDGFFEKTPVESKGFDGPYYRLNLNKERVKRLLGI